MIKLLKRTKLGFETYTVLWEHKGEFRVKDFWSEEAALNYIGWTFPHIALKTVEIEEVKYD